MINVIFLVAEFAPVNTTGNFRTLKFVKHLPALGINPVVVTLPSDKAASIFNARIDPVLMEEIDSETPIYRIDCDTLDTSGNKLKRFLDIFFNTTDRIADAWAKNLKAQIEPIIASHRPIGIYTSLPPFSCGMLAAEIAEEYKLPLVTDMRDLFAYWGSHPHSTYCHFRRKLKLERKIFIVSSRVIGVTPQLVHKFRNSHPSINPDKFIFIPNGLDFELKETSFFTSTNKTKYTIGYVGSFYYDPESRNNAMTKWWKRKGHRKLQYFASKEDWLYRSPHFFLKALRTLLIKYPHLREIVRFEYIGKEPSWLPEMITSFGLAGIYYSHGFVSNQEAIAIQRKFDALLATSEKIFGAEHVCMPSKVFEYLQMNKPILGFVTDGIQKDFLSKCGAGVFCDPDDTESAADQMYNLITKQREFKLNIPYLVKFTRQEAAIQLAGIFNNLSSKSLN